MLKRLGSRFGWLNHEGEHNGLRAGCGLVVLAIVLLSGIEVSAQEANSEKSAAEKEEMIAFLEDARKYIIESPKDRITLSLNEKSLLNWTNPVRQQERGAVYVWTQDNRPLAIGSFFTYVYNDKVYLKHEFHSLSTKPLKSTYGGRLAWTPQAAGIQWIIAKGIAEPAKTHTARALQIRELSRRFRAELNSPMNERSELRLVSRPLLEYASPKQQVIDGAIFSYAVATDPEVLLLVEAFEETAKGSTSTGYRYAFARFHYWNVVVFEGDTRVWEAALDSSHATNSIGKPENITKIYNSYHPNP